MSMFRRKTIIDKRDLITSELHDEHSFNERFLEVIEYAKQSVYIESPFISASRGMPLLPCFSAIRKSGRRITILARRPSFHDPLSALEANNVIRSLRSIGANIKFSSSRQHRKLVIIDDTILYKGSLNVVSHIASEEIMRRLESRELVQQMKDYLRFSFYG